MRYYGENRPGETRSPGRTTTLRGRATLRIISPLISKIDYHCPCDSSQRSASMAAMQPEPAAVTA